MTPETIIENIIRKLEVEGRESSLLLDKLLDATHGPMNYTQAAEYLKCEETTLKTKVCRGDIPHHKQIGVKFYRAELNIWVKESKFGRRLRKAS